MNVINKLERKYRKYAISNLMRYIIVLYALGFLLDAIAPGFMKRFWHWICMLCCMDKFGGL